MKIKLAKNVHLKISKNGYLTYIYSFKDLKFNFTLLSEVGQCIQHIYREYFEKNNHHIETVKFNEKPYLQDRIVNYEKLDG